ncbi:MAG: ABC transporter substrate-binding protein [Candidatus Eremiobacteraeota bacterium]|nr:ABC transporter substrate-binding protein [Candidatus Eremiobacteraeota bacterium]MBV8354735.1 ABC transporter substrate-binding protein [Candidatus Eremiobacteraeota bacterium]
MKIVSLLPSATEILFLLDLGDQVVGVTHECDHPPPAKEKPRLTRSLLPDGLRPQEIDRHVRARVHAGSSLYALDADLLEKLAPDLIVTQELCPVCAVSYDVVARAAKRLRGDPRILSLEPSSVEDVFSNITTVAEIAGVPERAAAAIAALRERLRSLRSATQTLSRPRTLVLEWTDPPMSGGHWTPELVEAAGGEPILSHPHADSQVLAWDDIAAADPDAILIAPCGFDLPTTQRAIGELQAAPNGIWLRLRAVREGRAFPIDGNAYVNRPGPRLVDSAEIFARALHPGAFI